MTVTATDRFEFDLRGYLVVRGVLDPDQVQSMCRVLDARGLDADASQRNILDSVKQQNLVPGEVDVGVDLIAGELADLLRAVDHRMALPCER